MLHHYSRPYYSCKNGKLTSDTRTQQISKVTHKDVKKIQYQVCPTQIYHFRKLVKYWPTVAIDPTYDQTLDLIPIITLITNLILTLSKTHQLWKRATITLFTRSLSQRIPGLSTNFCHFSTIPNRRMYYTEVYSYKSKKTQKDKAINQYIQTHF